MKSVFAAAVFSLGAWSLGHAATVNINPIQVCDDAGANCAPANFNQSFTDKIFAGSDTTLSFGPVRRLDSSRFLNPTARDARNLIQSSIFAGTQRKLLAYDVWFVDLIDGDRGFRGLGALGGDGAVIASSAAVDTLAHEIGHNFGFPHTKAAVMDRANFLLAPGADRTIPMTLDDIAPDGRQLGRFEPILPAVTVGVAGSTPFASDDFFDVSFLPGAEIDLPLEMLTIDLSPAGAFFDVTNDAPGRSGSAFAFGALAGVTASDVTVTGLVDGGSTLSLGFAPDSFTSGDSLSFGVDIDLFSKIDRFGATPDELASILVTLTFQNGSSKSGPLNDRIFSTAFDPNANLDVRAVAFGDPVTVAPLPAGVLLLATALSMLGLCAVRRAGPVSRAA